MQVIEELTLVSLIARRGIVVKSPSEIDVTFSLVRNTAAGCGEPFRPPLEDCLIGTDSRSRRSRFKSVRSRVVLRVSRRVRQAPRVEFDLVRHLSPTSSRIIVIIMALVSNG